MYHAIIISVQNVFITRNLGAHKIASFLRKQDWDVEVIDYAGLIGVEYIAKIVKTRVSEKTVFIGFSDTWGTVHYLDFSEITNWLREKFPRVKIIVGGQKIVRSPIPADYYIEGYSENAILEVIKHILGTNTEKLKYTLYGKGKLIKATLDYPSIFMKDLTVQYEARDFIQSNEQLGIEWSRGCKFSCDFCSYQPLGVRGDNFREVQNYVDNMNYLYDNFGVTTFFSADSTANVNSEKLKLLADATQTQIKFDPWIMAFARVDLMIAHPETWDDMIAMGYTGHTYGIESFNHKTGKAIKKGMHPDKVKQGLIDIEKYFKEKSFYRTRTTFICGLPYETYDSFLSGIKWIRENLECCSPIYYPLNIYNRNKRFGKESNSISENYEKYGYTNLNTDNDTDDVIDWVNHETGTSFKGAYDVVINNPLCHKGESLVSGWLIGEQRLTFDLDFYEAATKKWIDSREATIGYANTSSDFWKNPGVYEYLKKYVVNKLNYNK
jgi:radical SAM superfamily enzyme YgiQ (UPF0313 family)